MACRVSLHRLLFVQRNERIGCEWAFLKVSLHICAPVMRIFRSYPIDYCFVRLQKLKQTNASCWKVLSKPIFDSLHEIKLHFPTWEMCRLVFFFCCSRSFVLLCFALPVIICIWHQSMYRKSSIVKHWIHHSTFHFVILFAYIQLNFRSNNWALHFSAYILNQLCQHNTPDQKQTNHLYRRRMRNHFSTEIPTWMGAMVSIFAKLFPINIIPLSYIWI